MQIALSLNQIVELAAAYDVSRANSTELENVVIRRMQVAAARGYMEPDDLTKLAEWKWQGNRTRKLCALNDNDELKEVTATSFGAKSERLKIVALTALQGVGWPMASAILHFAFVDEYPILDVRAMKTVGGSTIYTFEKWDTYTRLCREKAAELGVSMRTLDKALWQANKVRCLRLVTGRLRL